MLFRLEKGRGRAKGTEGYLRYEPWHAPSYYSGALQFSVGDRPFYLERNFYHKEPRARLCNLADGENCPSRMEYGRQEGSGRAYENFYIFRSAGR